MPLTLAELPIGPYAIVQSMPTGRSSLTRLREMGIVPGTLVRVTRRAPLGEPIEISVRGSRLSMRNHEAAFIGITTGHEGVIGGVVIE
jgi:ferrous iron transport protein A